MNFMVVKTIDGVEHVYNFTKDLIVHGGKNPGVEGLEGLREGTTVAVHFSTGGTKASADEIDVLGDEGLSIVEGVITDMRRYAIMRCRSWPDDRPPSRLTALWREESPNSEGQCAG